MTTREPASSTAGAPGAGAGASPPAPIEFYFDFISLYGYFASLRIEALAAHHGRKVDWHIMLLGVSVMKVMGLKPLLETPMKGDYVVRDCARYMRQHGIVLARDLLAPMMDPRPAARALCWVRRHHPERTGPFVAAAYDAYWREARDLGVPDEVAAVAPAIGLDAPTLRAAIDSDEARTDLRDSVAATLDLGVFGSPFIRVDGEPFWGSDRLEMVDAWLAHGGW